MIVSCGIHPKIPLSSSKVDIFFSGLFGFCCWPGNATLARLQLPQGISGNRTAVKVGPIQKPDYDRNRMNAKC